MFRRLVHFALALAAAAAVTSVTASSQADPRTEINDGKPVIYLVNAAMIEKTEYGYRYTAGKQNSDITITLEGGKLRYVDTGTEELRDIPKSCSRQPVPQGIAALCTIPEKFANAGEMFLEVHPRLGNDNVDGSSLPSMFRVWFLGDKGDDNMRGGDGQDFCNGAQDNDRCWGGNGNDWLRTGIGNDVIYGDGGNDKLVALDGQDLIHGGDGNDGVYGGPGNDTLSGGGGTDKVICAGGRDDAWVDGDERPNACENVSRS